MLLFPVELQGVRMGIQGLTADPGFRESLRCYPNHPEIADDRIPKTESFPENEFRQKVWKKEIGSN